MRVTNLLGKKVVDKNKTIDKLVFIHLDRAKSITDNDYKPLEFVRLSEENPRKQVFEDVNEALGNVGLGEEVVINKNLGGI